MKLLQVNEQIIKEKYSQKTNESIQPIPYLRTRGREHSYPRINNKEINSKIIMSKQTILELIILKIRTFAMQMSNTNARDTDKIPYGTVPGSKGI
jgi:hypothetical protein